MTIYLYVKQCTHCGLKYFGKTVSKDPFKYKGSGTHWRNHIKKHCGYTSKTIEVWGFDNQEDCTRFAIAFSREHDIVNSKDWANLIEENGIDGLPPGHIKSEETRKKLSQSLKGKMPWNNGLIGVQVSQYKGVTDRYSEDQLHLISRKTKEAMNLISEDIKKSYYANRDSCNDRRWINNGTNHKRVKREDISYWLNSGWYEGRIIKQDQNGRFVKER